MRMGESPPKETPRAANSERRTRTGKSIESIAEQKANVNLCLAIQCLPQREKPGLKSHPRAA